MEEEEEEEGKVSAAIFSHRRRNKAAWCSTAECCAKIAKDPADAQVCKDFYDSKVGIAWQSVSAGKWAQFALPGQGLLHSKAPEASVKGGQQQCVSISHSGKGACPYPGAKAKWTMTLSVNNQSNFWEFFQECQMGAAAGELTGQCTDGFRCAVHERMPVVQKGWTYEKWLQAKNAIMDQTGTAACKINSYPNAYNEFDTNGFSKPAVSGIMIPDCLAKQKDASAPSKFVACRALNKINSKKWHWPVFKYSTKGGISSL